MIMALDYRVSVLTKLENHGHPKHIFSILELYSTFSFFFSLQMNIWRHGAPDDTSSAVCNSTPSNTTTYYILLFAVLLESLNFALVISLLVLL